MQYLNFELLDRVSAEQFRSRPPFPWAQIEDSLTPEAYELLRSTMPGTESFAKHIGVKRAHGQMSHDRYMLHYRAGLELPQPWREFIAELNGPRYHKFLGRLLGPRNYICTFSWHYAWAGCSVSPHCDAARKRATHIFHFNDPADWNPAWGGATLILASDKPLPTHSAPTWDELTVAGAGGPAGNGSLIFQRTDHSWHGMKPLACPEDKLRKIFSITINVPTAQVLWRRIRGKDPDGFPLRAK